MKGAPSMDSRLLNLLDWIIHNKNFTLRSKPTIEVCNSKIEQIIRSYDIYTCHTIDHHVIHVISKMATQFCMSTILFELLDDLIRLISLLILFVCTASWLGLAFVIIQSWMRLGQLQLNTWVLTIICVCMCLYCKDLSY